MLFGVQPSPVSRDEPEPLTIATLFLSLAICATLSAMPELIRLAIMSTLSASYHSRALEAATSGLFWWSAMMSSIGLPSTLPPKSSIAMLARP